MLFVLASRGWEAEKISVSPLAGVPAKPQLALSFQLPEVLLPPDQLRVLPWTAVENRPAHTATIPIKDGRIVEKDENRIKLFAFFIGTCLQGRSFEETNNTILDE
jgi:hypothetical protein